MLGGARRVQPLIPGQRGEGTMMAGAGKNVEIEILVHASAPSRGKDDTRYRALATAYLDFEPASSRTLWGDSTSLEDGLEHGSLISGSELDALLQQDCLSQDSFGDDRDKDQQQQQPCEALRRRSSNPAKKIRTPSAPLESPQISFDSASDNLNSPPLRLSRSVDGQRPGKAPPRAMGEPRPPGDRSVPDLPPSEMISDLHSQHYGAFQSSRSESPTLPVLPSSPMMARRSPILQADPDPKLAATLSQSPTTSHIPEYSSSPIRLAGPPSRRRRIEFISPDRTSRSEFLVEESPQERPKPRVSSSPTILPPPPASVDLLTPQSLITPHLLRLADQLSLQTRYRPKSQSRPLQSFERGYWSVPIREWFSIRFWNALAKYVESGRAGWGVWVSRERAANCRESINEDEELRVYCWGEVVGHIYLLLYLASERQIKGKEVRWVDGEGKVIIVMGV